MSRVADPQLEQLWRQTFAAWQKSGLSVRAYCARRQLSEARFYAWRRELARRDRQQRPTARFVPIHVRSAAAIEIVLPDGLLVRASAEVEAASVAALVAALRAFSC